MICPYLINISLLVGAILSWGIMWPLIDAKKDDWYSGAYDPGSLHGLQGYKVINPSYYLIMTKFTKCYCS